MVDYHSIIQKHISPDSEVYGIYMVHVTLVTNMALKIGRRLKMGDEALKFIEEAAMLHDIGIVKTNAPGIGCHGNLPYLAHLQAGKEILQEEGLTKHAKVAANHIGIGGLSAEEIIAQDLPLPHEDILCETLEERIISYSDSFYSKNKAKLWKKKGKKDLRSKLKKRPEHRKRFEEWHKVFGT